MQEEKFKKNVEFNRGIIMQSLLREECGIKGFSDLANENVVILEQGSENISFLTKERKSNSFWIVDAVCDRGSAAKFSLRGINEDMFGSMCKLAKTNVKSEVVEAQESAEKNKVDVPEWLQEDAKKINDDIEQYFRIEALANYKEAVTIQEKIEALRLLAEFCDLDCFITQKKPHVIKGQNELKDFCKDFERRLESMIQNLSNN